MRIKTRPEVLLFAVLAVLACSSPVQAFSFCFSFGNNNHNYSPYSRYQPPYPPPPAALYPAAPAQLPPPAAVNSPVYPPRQSYGVLVPVQPGW